MCGELLAFRGITKLAADPAHPLVAAAGLDGTVRIWNIRDPRHPQPLGQPLGGHDQQPVTSLAFSPDGNLLASGGQDQQIVLWSIDWDGSGSQATVRRLHGTLYQTQTILALAFSPDGKTLAAGDGDGSACVYEVESRRFIGGPSCLPGNFGLLASSGGIDSVLFSSDGTKLLTAGDWNPIVAWDSILWDQGKDDQTAETVRASVCALAGRNLTAGEWGRCSPIRS